MCTSVKHFCVCQYIHLSISSSISCQQLYHRGPIIPVDQHHCWSLAVLCMAGIGTYVFLVLFLIAVLLSVWTGGLLMYAQAMCCRLVLIVHFLCSIFILSQAYATTTPPVTVVCSGASVLLMTITMAPTLMGLPATQGQHDVVLLPLLILRDTRGVVGHCPRAATSVLDTSSGLC